MFKVGDKVTIKAAFCDDGDNGRVHEVVAEANVMNRVQIAPVEWPYAIRPIELVGVEMVEAV